MQTSPTSHKPATSLRLPTIVTRKGQMTIPAPLREVLGIKEGDTISVTLEGQEMKLEPVSLSLAESYQSVSALSTPQSWKDVREIAHEDHAAEVMKKASFCLLQSVRNPVSQTMVHKMAVCHVQ